MSMRNTHTKYGSISKFFHWLIAIIVLCMFVVGVVMVDMELNSDKLRIYALHKSFGTLIILLAALRLFWRFNNPSPQLPIHMKSHERFLAHSSHIVLYLFLFYMPVVGWLMSSAAGFPVSFFGLFNLPDLISPDKNLLNVFKAMHKYGAYLFFFMITAHFLAALVHHYYYKDNVLLRMLPFNKGAR